MSSAEPFGHAAPVPPTERLHWLDVLRGFTLAGVLVVNLGDYSVSSRTGDDPLWYQLMGAATGGKFATLFQLVFGVGFAIQMTRWEVKGASVVPRYLRRCIALWIIGWCAEVFTGNGMILVAYATTALVLILFRGASARTLLAWGLALGALDAGAWVDWR